MPEVNNIPTVDVQVEEVKSVFGPPELVWLTKDSNKGKAMEQNKAPNEYQLYKYGDDPHCLRSDNFWEKVLEAHRIYIVDPYWDVEEMCFLRDILKGNKGLKTLKILCDPVDKRETEWLGIFKELKKNLLNIKRDRELKLRVVKKKQSSDKRSGFPDLHDRFAAVDDELWHFGSKVGGLHNSLTAYSRGWDVNTHGFLPLFNLYWERASYDRPTI